MTRTLIDKMEVIDCSQASMDAFNSDLTILTSFNTSTIPNFNLNNEEKNEMSALISAIANTFTCKVQSTCSSNNARLNGSSDESNCDYDEISDKSEQLYEMLDEAEAKTFIKYTVGFPAPSAAKLLNDQSLSYGNFGSLGRANNNPSDENWQSGTESSPIKPQEEIAKIEYAKEITNIAYPDVPYYEGQRRDLEAEVLETSICPAEVTDAQLIQKMSFPFTLVGGVSKYWNLPENYPELIFNRFLENSREDYHTDAQVAKLVFESTQGKNMLRNIVTYFHKTIKDKGLGYEGSFQTDNAEEHNIVLPKFISEGYGVLFALMGGTQQIRVLVKELNLNDSNYEAVLVVQLMDIFGADEDDWAEKFTTYELLDIRTWALPIANGLLANEAKQSLVAFYALQKQRGYEPFRVINTFTITLDNVSLNAIPD